MGRLRRITLENSLKKSGHENENKRFKADKGSFGDMAFGATGSSIADIQLAKLYTLRSFVRSSL